MSVTQLPERDQKLVYDVLWGRKAPSLACKEASVDRYTFTEAMAKIGPSHKFVDGRWVERPYWKRQVR